MTRAAQTALRLYNSLTKKEEVFEPASKKHVTMYTCGPTVYGRPHIGNYASFLMGDLLHRLLKHLGYDVTYAKNITDVGHLVRDADEGEDKIEKQAREENGKVTMETVIAIARKYEQQYLDDERALNMLEPTHRPRATAHIDDMKKMIEELLAKNIAYITSDGIYFDVTSFPQYGALSGNTLENLNAGSRIDVNEEKKHPADFALWKFCVGANESHVLRWSSPAFAQATAGKPTKNSEKLPDGFPGWHIECSAMSRALLGDTIDIHTGGEDNIFPHHECEIAQSESITKKPFVKFWLHKRRIDLEGEKMSKSLGNTLMIPDICQKGFSPLDIRYYLLSVHYRTNLKFSWKGLEDSKKARRKIVEWMIESAEFGIRNEESNIEQEKYVSHETQKFMDAMTSDLNTPGALGIIFDVMAWSRNQESFSEEALTTLRAFIVAAKNIFGCFDEETEEKIPDDVQKLFDERKEARAQKNFVESDRLRDAIAKHGYEVRDRAGGQTLKKL